MIETAREARLIAARKARLDEARSLAKASTTPPVEEAPPIGIGASAMRLLHEIVVAGKRLRIERAPSGMNHYFVNDRDMGIEAYFAVTAAVHAATDQAVRLVRSA